MAEYNYDAATTRSNRYPRIKKLGVCSPNGEMTPFVWKGQLMRLELDDPLNGTDDSILRQAIIRNCETGEVLSRFGDLFDTIFDNEGNDRDMKLGNIIDRRADRRVKVTFQDATKLRVVRSYHDDVALERADDRTWYINVPAAQMVILALN